MGLGVGRRNRSVMRELAGELERKKIEEERRKKRSRRERGVIIFFFFKLQTIVCSKKSLHIVALKLKILVIPSLL